MRPVLALLLLAILSPPAGVRAQTPGPSIAPDPSPATEPSPLTSAEGTWFASPVWSRLPVEHGPAAREDATWTVDADGASAYLFGGRDGKTTFDDLWRFDLATDTWTRLRPDSGPSARFGHSAAWAEGTGLVVFGGQRETAFFDDLWAYDPSADRWRKLPRRGQAPAARYGTCATIDRDGRFVISHGFTSNGRFDDTRAYDLDRERWVAISPDGRRPGERCLHDCFVDASTAGWSSTAGRTTAHARSAISGDSATGAGLAWTIRLRLRVASMPPRRLDRTSGSSAAPAGTIASSTTSGGSTVRRSRSPVSDPTARCRPAAPGRSWSPIPSGGASCSSEGPTGGRSTTSGSWTTGLRAHPTRRPWRPYPAPDGADADERLRSWALTPRGQRRHPS